jgi:hypothetical protein
MRYMDKIEVKCLVKIKTGLYLTAINKNLEILAQTRSYFSILIFCPPIATFPFFDWIKITMPPLVLFIISMVGIKNLPISSTGTL